MEIYSFFATPGREVDVDDEFLMHSMHSMPNFYKNVHGITLRGTHTICGVADELWRDSIINNNLKVTCPECLKEINHCIKVYKNA